MQGAETWTTTRTARLQTSCYSTIRQEVARAQIIKTLTSTLLNTSRSAQSAIPQPKSTRKSQEAVKSRDCPTQLIRQLMHQPLFPIYWVPRYIARPHNSIITVGRRRRPPLKFSHLNHSHHNLRLHRRAHGATPRHPESCWPSKTINIIHSVSFPSRTRRATPRVPWLRCRANFDRTSLRLFLKHSRRRQWSRQVSRCSRQINSVCWSTPMQSRCCQRDSSDCIRIQRWWATSIRSCNSTRTITCSRAGAPLSRPRRHSRRWWREAAGHLQTRTQLRRNWFSYWRIQRAMAEGQTRSIQKPSMPRKEVHRRSGPLALWWTCSWTLSICSLEAHKSSLPVLSNTSNITLTNNSSTIKTKSTQVSHHHVATKIKIINILNNLLMAPQTIKIPLSSFCQPKMPI